MLAVYLSPVYILLNLYILRWLLRWMNACSSHFYRRGIKAAVMTVYSFLALAVLIGFWFPKGSFGRLMKLTGNYWLGVMLYALIVIAIADFLRVIFRKLGVMNRYLRLSCVGTVCVAVTAAVCLAGAVNARVIRTVEYDAVVEKKAGDLDDLRIILAADLHLGYNTGSREMEQMVKKINVQKPDLVVIAGDIFDNEYDALDDPKRLISILKRIKSKYGVYACYGNHDVEEKILAGFTFGGKHEKKESDTRMDEFLEKAGINLLRDEGVLIDHSFYLYGRPDLNRPGRGIEVRKTAREITQQMDQEKPIIVLDHEPKELEALAQAGVDLDLSGHTHNGQVFPGNIAIRFMWENPYGYLRIGEMHNIVTSGIGVFGPYIRVGTKAEICVVNVEFR